LEQAQFRTLEMNAQHKIAFSELFETLCAFQHNFESVSQGMAVDIEDFGNSQQTANLRIAELLESLQIAEGLRAEATQQANKYMSEKAAMDSQIDEAKAMLQCSEQNRNDNDNKLRDLQADMASAECKIEALLVSLDSSERQKNENMQELKALIFEREGFTSKICELTSCVEAADLCRQQAELKIQELTTEQTENSERLSELLSLLEQTNSEKADLELQLQNVRVDKENAEIKVAELATLEQEKCDLRSSIEDTRCASIALMDSFLELNYASEMNLTPDMSIAEKYAACQSILKLVLADITKANETEMAFNKQIALLKENIDSSELEIKRLQSHAAELEISLNSSSQEQHLLTQQNGLLTDKKIELEAKVKSLETIREDLIAKQNNFLKEKETLIAEKDSLILENQKLLDCQVLLCCLLDHGVDFDAQVLHAVINSRKT
jgi:chromosome segregation ATPase